MPPATEFPPVFPPIEDLIPHRPPVRLLDAVTDCTETGLKAVASITSVNSDSSNTGSSNTGNSFSTQHGVPACIGLEYLGQAAAAFFSVRALASGNDKISAQPPTPGMLIASRSYSCTAGYFPPDCTLHIEIQLTSPLASSGLVKFSGRIRLDSSERHNSDRHSSDKHFAQGDLSVYLPSR